MQDEWTIKVAAFVPKIIALLPKLFSLVITLIAIAGGIILALVLSGDIDKDGFIKINRGVIIKFAAAVCTSLFVGSLIIDVWHLQYLGIMSQGCIFFMTAVFGLLSIGVIYLSIQLMGCVLAVYSNLLLSLTYLQI